MPRNPFTVLGLPPDATLETIKVTWRRLARQHHPDVATGDKAKERRANKTMAEINAAYHELRDPDKRRIHRDAAARTARVNDEQPAQDGPPPPPFTRPGWVPRPRTRPVTARIDTSALLRPRNATLTQLERSPLPGLPPRPRFVEEHEPRRASTPTGPMHRRPGPNLEADLPVLADAMETRLNFGKFAGLTLGDVASQEPSYVAWIVRTIDRDPEITLAARVVLRYLERFGAVGRGRLDTAVPRS
ncbi:MAG: DnaJ domain-containing protein [Candidatus Limnocylindrales bacterium]